MAELGTNSDSEDFAEVKEWLESCNLLKYFSGFKKHDYDDLKLIREMNEKQIEGRLEEVGITSNGHKLKFMSALTILKSVHDNPVELQKTSHTQDCGESSKSFADVAEIICPVHLKDLIIPNPLKESHLFYNNVLFDLVKASYELMAPEQFRSYVISQRVHRWKLNENFNRIKSQFQDLLRNGKSGNARNVSKYASEDQGSFLAKDVRRIENTEAVVKGLFDKVSSLKSSVTSYRSNLFNKELQIRPWKANELSYYDKFINECKQMEDEITSKITQMQNLTNQLKRKFSKDSIDEEEEKRKRWRQIQNSKKAENKKLKRRDNSTLILMKDIVGDHLTQATIKKVKELGKLNSETLGNLKISSSDLEKFQEQTKITSRFYLGQLEHLLELNLFEENAIQKVTELISSLKEQASKTLLDNKEKAERLKEKQKQLKNQLTLDVAERLKEKQKQLKNQLTLDVAFMNKK